MYNFANVLISNRCNLRCQHCYLGKLNGEFAKYNEVVAILDKLRALRIHSVQFSGGECTIHPNFIDILKYAKFQGFDVSIFTNGIHIPKDALQYIDKVFLSLDGPENIHNIIRGVEGAFSLTVKTIEELYLMKKKFSVQLTLNKTNIEVAGKIKETLSPYIDILMDIRLVKMISIGSAVNLVNEEIKNEELWKIKLLKKEFCEYFHYRIPILDDVYRVEDIYTFALHEKKQYPLWIDCVSNLFYVYSNKPDFSLAVNRISQECLFSLNEKVKDCLRTKIRTVKSQYISIDDLLYK